MINVKHTFFIVGAALFFNAAHAQTEPNIEANPKTNYLEQKNTTALKNAGQAFSEYLLHAIQQTYGGVDNLATTMRNENKTKMHGFFRVEGAIANTRMGRTQSPTTRWTGWEILPFEFEIRTDGSYQAKVGIVDASKFNRLLHNDFVLFDKFTLFEYTWDKRYGSGKFHTLNVLSANMDVKAYLFQNKGREGYFGPKLAVNLGGKTAEYNISQTNLQEDPTTPYPSVKKIKTKFGMYSSTMIGLAFRLPLAKKMLLEGYAGYLYEITMPNFGDVAQDKAVLNAGGSPESLYKTISFHEVSTGITVSRELKKAAIGIFYEGDAFRKAQATQGADGLKYDLSKVNPLRQRVGIKIKF